MQDVISSLVFTTEVGADFTNGWLPTLDLELRMGGDNRVWHRFYEKPTAARTTVQGRIAME